MTDLAASPVQSVLEELRPLLGERLTTALAVREHHGKDETYHKGAPPDAVAWPHTTEEVSAIVRACAAASR